MHRIVAKKGGKYFLPIKLTIWYVMGTFALSVIGPVIYLRSEYEWWRVLVYLVIVFIFTYFGYYLGIYSPERAVNSSSVTSRGWNNTYKLLKYSLLISLISVALEIGYLAASGHLQISFAEVASTYFEEVDGSSGIMIFRFATDFFRLSSLALGFYSLKKLDKPYNVLVIINAVLIFIVTIFGYGQQKTVGDIFIYLATAILTINIRNNSKISAVTKRRIIVGGIAVLFLFAYIQSLRYSKIGVTAENYASRSLGEIGYDTDHLIFKIFGKNMGFGLAVILTSYMSMGYYGLSLCLKLPFVWSYGAGSSRALTKLLEKIGINNIEQRTYLARMQESFGRNGLASWNTIFPWLASDLSFLGTLFYFMIFGYIFAKAWREVLDHNNSISYLMVSIMFIMVFYIPANNQLFHSYGSFMSTLSVIMMWFLFRKSFFEE